MEEIRAKVSIQSMLPEQVPMKKTGIEGEGREG